jgi:hypothetical protein
LSLVFKLEKDKTKEEVVMEITAQLNLITEIELLNKIKTYLIDPICELAIWDYGKEETKYPVWLILKSEINDTGILFSEYGFGFGNWGLTNLSTKPIHFGPDYNWFSTLKEAFLDSCITE